MNKGNNSFLKLQFNYKIINHIKKKRVICITNSGYKMNYRNCVLEQFR